MITSELFSFDDNSHKDNKNHTINIGNKKFPLGKLQFKAHKEYNLPKSITISVNPSGHWFISFNSEEVINKDYNQINTIIRTQEELMYEFSLRLDLDKIVVGLDRGVVLPLATSTNSNYSIDKKVLAKIVKKEFRAKRYQRKLSRQQLGSKNRNKTKNKIGKLKQYQTNVRQDFSHKTSHNLVNSSAEVFVLENLKLKNMMAAPNPKQDAQGNYIANGSAAKAGLNKSLANSSLGLLKQFISYKAARRNKLVLSVNPAYSSQECSECHFIHKDNRLTQSIFKCNSCGQEDNADSNAAKVIKYRGIEFLKEFDKEIYKPKSKKTVRIRKKVGKVFPEPISVYLESKPVENMLDIEGIKLPNVQRSLNQETPTTSIGLIGE
jgi:putative transposase